MSKVGDILVREVVTFKPSDPIHFVAWSLRTKRISGAPVTEGKKVVGIVSEQDVMRLLEEKNVKINLFLPSPLDLVEFPLKMKKELNEIAEVVTKTAKTPVEEIMTKKVVTVTKDMRVGEAAKMMGAKKINRLPVVDDKGDLIGIITRGDVIGTLV